MQHKHRNSFPFKGRKTSPITHLLTNTPAHTPTHPNHCTSFRTPRPTSTGVHFRLQQSPDYNGFGRSSSLARFQTTRPLRVRVVWNTDELKNLKQKMMQAKN